jgi:hypothetical protein
MFPLCLRIGYSVVSGNESFVFHIFAKRYFSLVFANFFSTIEAFQCIEISWSFLAKALKFSLKQTSICLEYRSVSNLRENFCENTKGNFPLNASCVFWNIVRAYVPFFSSWFYFCRAYWPFSSWFYFCRFPLLCFTFYLS